MLPCRWGCKLSQKLFVGRDYVLKHVRLKHTEKVEAQRTKASLLIVLLMDTILSSSARLRWADCLGASCEMQRVEQAGACRSATSCSGRTTRSSARRSRR